MDMPAPPLSDPVVAPLLAAVEAAGDRIMADWGRDHAVGRKPDGSPVTGTDEAAEIILIDALKALYPHKIVAEEETSRGDAPHIGPDEVFWLVDALDGTREFIAGGKDFTVNAALIRNRQPVLGIIRAPALGITWYAAHGEGAYRIREGAATRLSMRDIPADGVFLLGGKRAGEPVVLEPFIGDHRVAGRVQRSSSLKFCLLAEGQADLYPRLGETYEWDTAAGDIIVREAGGTVLDLQTSAQLQYGKQDTGFINRGFIAGNRALFRFRTPAP